MEEKKKKNKSLIVFIVGLVVGLLLIVMGFVCFFSNANLLNVNYNSNNKVQREVNELTAKKNNLESDINLLEKQLGNLNVSDENYLSKYTEISKEINDKENLIDYYSNQITKLESDLGSSVGNEIVSNVFNFMGSMFLGTVLIVIGFLVIFVCSIISLILYVNSRSEDIKKAGNQVKDDIKKAGSQVKDDIKKATPAVKTTAKDVSKEISKGYEKVAPVVKTTAKDVSKELSKGYDNLKKAVNDKNDDK